ncbi:Uncharacterized protein FKW44_001217, partial [Caligus rogercresseyi]
NDQGITWEDQWLQGQAKNQFDFPQSNFKRALSSKSLHDTSTLWDPHHQPLVP